MKRLVEVAAFAAASVLVHVVLFARMPDEGLDAGGAGGTAALSLQAADATVVEMVRTWDRPPAEVQTAVAQLPAPSGPPAPAPVPELPGFDLVQAPQAARHVSVPPPDTLPPVPDTASPPPLASPPDTLVAQPPADPAPPQQPEPSPDVAPEASPRPSVRPQAMPPKEVAEPARKAQQNSPARAAQRAAGSGGENAAGQSNRTQAATASKGQQAKAQQVWGAKIRSRIERAKRYPRGTDASGQASLVISIARGGQLLGVRIRQSSGNARLDQAALDAVRRAGRFPPAPEQLPLDSYSFSIPILLKQ
ncbi:TonB family protein [Sulfitobacter sp. LCG007]